MLRSCYDRDRTPRPTVPPDRYVRHTRRPYPRRCGTDRRRSGDRPSPRRPRHRVGAFVAAGCAQRHRLRLLHRHLAAGRHLPRAAGSGGGDALHRGRPALVRAQAEPEAELDFSHGDRFYDHAEASSSSCSALTWSWDEGFGDGWTDDDLWGLSRQEAADLLFGVVRHGGEALQGPYDGWIVANEVTDPEEATGRVPHERALVQHDRPGVHRPEAFHIAQRAGPGRAADHQRVRLRDRQPVRRQARVLARRALLKVLDTLLSQGVPVHAVGIQAHLLADRFAERFNARGYRQFLGEIADRGLHILDHRDGRLRRGSAAAPARRDRGVADVYRRYLDVALDEAAVKVVVAFGLTDKYTWLDEDYPARRRRPPPAAAVRPQPAAQAGLLGARPRLPSRAGSQAAVGARRKQAANASPEPGRTCPAAADRNRPGRPPARAARPAVAQGGCDRTRSDRGEERLDHGQVDVGAEASQAQPRGPGPVLTDRSAAARR